MNKKLTQTMEAIERVGGSAVLTGVDTNGYPVSLRCRPRISGDALVIDQPAWFRIADGAASLCAHSHNERTWNLRASLVKGSVTTQHDRLLFRPHSYFPLADGNMIRNIKYMRRARTTSTQYLLPAHSSSRERAATPIVRTPSERTPMNRHRQFTAAALLLTAGLTGRHHGRTRPRRHHRRRAHERIAITDVRKRFRRRHRDPRRR